MAGAQSGTNRSSRPIGEDAGGKKLLALNQVGKWGIKASRYLSALPARPLWDLLQPSEVVNPPYKAVKTVLFSISKLERQLWNQSYPLISCYEESDADGAGAERLSWTGVNFYLGYNASTPGLQGALFSMAESNWHCFKVTLLIRSKHSEASRTVKSCFQSVASVFKIWAKHRKIPLRSHPATGITCLNFLKRMYQKKKKVLMDDGSLRSSASRGRISCLTMKCLLLL